MLITFRFVKKENGTFVAHTDILRALNRTLRRADINVNYSAGFNKHMLLKMTQPLPLGIASQAEYVTADIIEEMTTEEFLEKFNACCPPYLHAEEAYITQEKPKLASYITASKYFFKSKEALLKKDEIENCKKGYTFVYSHKDTEKTVDAGSLIYAIKVNEKGITALLASGLTNLRPDALSVAWNKDFGLSIQLSDIVRLEQYLCLDGKYQSATDYLEKNS